MLLTKGRPENSSWSVRLTRVWLSYGLTLLSSSTGLSNETLIKQDSGELVAPRAINDKMKSLDFLNETPIKQDSGELVAPRAINDKMKSMDFANTLCLKGLINWQLKDLLLWFFVSKTLKGSWTHWLVLSDTNVIYRSVLEKKTYWSYVSQKT